MKCNRIFLGTMLFKGQWTDDDGVLEVIDGQQRLTTTYLFLGALSNRLRATSEKIIEEYQNGLAQDEFAQHGKNSDWVGLAHNFKTQSEKIRDNRLQTQEAPGVVNTHPRLSIEVGEKMMGILVFGTDSERNALRPSCQAEQNLVDSYNYMYEQLSLNELRKNKDFAQFFENENEITPDMLGEFRQSEYDKRYRNYRNYEILLFGILKQLDTPSVVVLSMQSEERVNEVFESLNSKGKDLEQVDLIKNNVFERLPAKPLDKAHESWGNIKACLSAEQKDPNSTNLPWVNLETFFSFFWIAEQGGKGTRDKLYQEFVKTFENANQDDVLDFLQRGEDFAVDVAVLFGNEPLDFIDDAYRIHAEEGLEYLVRVQNAKQSFPLLAAALHACRKKAMKSQTLVELLDFLAVALLLLKDVRGSMYTAILRSTAYALMKISYPQYIAKNRQKELSTWYVRHLKDSLAEQISDDNAKAIIKELVDGSDLLYSNKTDDAKSHTRVRYLLRVHCFRMLCDGKGNTAGTESNFVWNVEHILPDSKDDPGSITHQLGNLLWLDKNVNDQCTNKSVKKKLSLYQDSHNPEVKELGEFFDDLQGDEQTQERAIKERSVRIMMELYSWVVKKRIKHTDQGGTQTVNHADDGPSNRYLAFADMLKRTQKKYLQEMKTGDWYHSFASRLLCEKKGTLSPSIYGIALPDSESFTTPFLWMNGEEGIRQIDILLQYIDKQVSEGYVFRRVGGKAQDEPFPSNCKQMLQLYRQFLLNRLEETATA